MMFQPEVKLEFVRRYCSPANGWRVFVDIDPSEEGKTGGKRTTPEGKRRQREVGQSAAKVRKQFESLGVQVGGSRKKWLKTIGADALYESFPCLTSDRDVVAIQPDRRYLVIAEVEGQSSGQPEQKLYKAIGQLVLAVSVKPENGWKAAYVLVVHGNEIATQLAKASILKQLNISALHLAKHREKDQWLFRDELLPKLVSSELRGPRPRFQHHER